MRYIFIDEAGTSALEPVTVVVGVIADADEHVLLAEASVREACGSVPKEYQKDFVFHATQVFGDRRYQEHWGLTDRLHFLKSMMSIPRRTGMAIAVGAQWRGSIDFSWSLGALGLSLEQSDHLQAFFNCVSIADRGIRDNAHAREVASLVVEDIPEMRKVLKLVPGILRDNPISLRKEHLRETVSDVEAGYLKQSGDIRVTRIRGAVHFVEKQEDPLVQVADACAYGIRRYFAEQKFGMEFVREIFGTESVLRNFGAPGGAEVYWPNQ